jgi:diguanylate cyclase (GGDEF)-like protein/PAS domain S-box-containing protein
VDGTDEAAGQQRTRLFDRAPVEALLAPTALRAVLEGLPDATVASGSDGRIVFVNRLAEEQFGWRSGELIGQPVSILWPERLRARYTRNMQLYFATEHPMRFTLRAYGLRRDGSEFVGEMSWGVVETDAGPLLLAIGRDISERRATEARLRRQSRQQAAIAALGERALAGADLADLAAEAVERMQDTLPVLAVSIRKAGAPQPLAAWTQGRGGGAATTVDIRTGEETFGTLSVRTVSELGEDEQSFLRAIANVLATALGRLRDESRMRHEALHDPLTGLANRTLCHDRLTHALARSGRTSGVACVLFVDLDSFKRVNDLYGHAAGDALLVAIGQRLVATVRPADTVARLGGDEFVVVCEDVDEPAAVALGERVEEAIREPLVVDDAEHRLSASIGIALGRAGHTSPDALLADADAAAYRAKSEGRSRVEVFDGRLRKHALERLHTAAALERALSLGQLRLEFQPILTLADDAVIGHEALLRWDRPGGVMAAPADFIPVAEESALIVEIGAWALREACRTSAAAHGADPRGPTIWVNLSGRQLAQPDLPELVADCLQESGLPASRLRLELTETVLVHAPATGIRNLAELKRMDVTLVLDDFGTGYSSLAHLRDFPVDGVKIDRTFIADLGRSAGDTAIVAAIVSLAAALGLDAVAEGVEEKGQAALLRELGCPLAQGFLFARPGPRMV